MFMEGGINYKTQRGDPVYFPAALDQECPVGKGLQPLWGPETKTVSNHNEKSDQIWSPGVHGTCWDLVKGHLMYCLS